MTGIKAVRTAFPVSRYPQAEFTRTIGELCELDPPQRALLKRLHQNSGVETRHAVLPLDQYAGLGGLRPTNERYIEEAVELGAEAMTRALKAADLVAEDVDLLIITSVTGVAVPSLDARLIPRLGLRRNVKRLPIFGLGCVAGAAGLGRLHDYLLGWPGHTAALVAVELCTLSWPRSNVTPADLVASGLFGDGAAALVARGGEAGGGPTVLASRSQVIPASNDALGWRLDSDGFRIILTAELADIIEGQLCPVVRDFLAEHQLTTADIQTWICHPGGPKVLDAVERSLGLPGSALATSRRSLAEVGNLSSVSVLHILEETLRGTPPPPGTTGLMIGLGPGVSVELVLLRW
jgi:alkylresorcinol/alkylpyrone synthase